MNSGNEIDNNTSFENSVAGIYVQRAESLGSTQSRITNNSTYGNSCDGIQIDNFDDGVIASNNSHDNLQYGYLYSTNSSGNTMTPANTWGSNGVAASCGSGSGCSFISGCSW